MKSPQNTFFECSTCPAKFALKYSTSKHISTVHEGKKKNHPSPDSLKMVVALNTSQSNPN